VQSSGILARRAGLRGRPGLLALGGWLAAAALLFALSWGVSTGAGIWASDAWGIQALSLMRSESLSIFMRTLHKVQGWFDAVVIAGWMAWLLWRRRWTSLWWFALAVPGGMLANSGLKLLVQRPRPEWASAAVGAHGFSFPSGHVAAATLLVGYVVWQIVRRTSRRGVRFVAACVAFVVVAAVACSRVYLGLHFPSDALAGVLLGITWLGLCIGAPHVWMTRGSMPWTRFT
jgi:undecaprenyl-diphosphatase